MPDYVQVAGLVEVKVLVPGGSLTKLGEQMDMTEIEERAFWHNVPGDRHGGPQGPPIEVQYLGSTVLIRCDLSRWDPAVIDAVRKRAVNTTLGAVAATEVGALMLRDRAIRLVLDCPTRPRNFPCCLVREPIRYGKGTKFTSYALEFEAHRKPEEPDQYVLWNTTTT